MAKSWEAMTKEERFSAIMNYVEGIMENKHEGSLDAVYDEFGGEFPELKRVVTLLKAHPEMWPKLKAAGKEKRK